LRISFILLIHAIGVIILAEFAVYNISGGGSNVTSNTIMATNSTEHKPDIRNSSTPKTHSDLIRSCSTFREILSADMAYSCDYSMLYYKGQCELYSDLLMQNKTDAILKAENDLSFCSDPKVGKYIQDHGLTNTPRSPSLIPGYELPIA
jgi:hypothetical protein